MMKGADSPYWKRPQYKALTAAKWDIIIIMLVRSGGSPSLLSLPGCSLAPIPYALLHNAVLRPRCCRVGALAPKKTQWRHASCFKSPGFVAHSRFVADLRCHHC